MTKRKPRAALYARISDARGDDTAGVDRQLADCDKLAARQGFTVVARFTDNNVSAMKSPLWKRRQGALLLEAIDRDEIDVVVAYSAERLYRRLGELDELAARLNGLPVETVSSGDVDLSTADGAMKAGIMAVVAQHESRKRGERVARAAQQRAEQGGFGGGQRRFGYSADATELVQPEADALQFAYKFIAAGGTLEAVVRDWRETVGTGPLGGRITGVQVRDTLLRPMNAGLSFYKGKEVGTTSLPTVIDAETWRDVHAILTDPSRRTTVGRPATTLLAPVLRCGVCGRRCSGAKRSRRSSGTAAAGKTPMYRCREGHVSRDRTRLDDVVTELIGEYLAANAERLKRPVVTGRDTSPDEAEALRSRLDALAQLAATGELDPADYAAAARGIRDRLAALEVRIAEAAGTPATSTLLAAGDVQAAWKAASIDVRRTVIKELLARIVINRGRPGPFTMDGVVVEWRMPEEAK